jgi:hypothetical protein
MKMLFNNDKGILLFLGAFLAPFFICWGQTNVSQPAATSQKESVGWEKAARSYTLAQRVEGSSRNLKTTAKNKKAGAPADGAQPAPPNDGDRMNAETESAQYQRIEEEGLLQTRQAMKAAEHDLTLQRQMGILLSHDPDPESLCLGESITALRILGSGTASRVP